MAIPKVHTKYVNQPKKIDEIKSKWWEQKENDIHNHVIGVVNSIEQNQSYRRLRNIQYARMYSNTEFKDFYGVAFSENATTSQKSRVALNVIKAICDSAAAKISKNKPKPMFLTEKGDYTIQNRAKKLTKYMEGIFDSCDMYTKGQKVFRDAEVFGTGALKFYAEDGEIKTERVMIDEIKVDGTDGMYGTPRQMFQTKYIHRDVLIDMFPKHEGKIRTAKGGITGETGSKSAADMIQVVEAWHLKSGGGAPDGKHVIAIDTCTLFEERYDKDYFPFVFLRWSDRILGFYGSGIPEEIKGIQVEINKLLRSIQVSQHLMSHPKWFVENASGVNTQHLNNEDGGIIKFNQTPPQAFVPQAMSGEVYSHLENLYSKAFEIVGVTQLSATGQKPSGLDSGVALREYNDIESERFILVGQAYEKMFMDASKIIVDMSRDLYKDNPNFKVTVKGKKFIETIKWADVDLEDDKFTMTVFPVSQLPNTPAGKLAFAQELIQGGFIEREYALSILDFPDLDAYVDNKTANIEILREIIEKMTEDGEYTAPEPYMDLAYNIKFTQRAYLQAKMDDVPEANLDLMRQFMDQNQAMIDVAMQQAQKQQQAMAQPEALPTSDLLPQGEQV